MHNPVRAPMRSRRRDLPASRLHLPIPVNLLKAVPEVIPPLP